MDFERLLLNKVVQTGEIEKLISEGISENHFLDPELQNIWKFLVDHSKTYKQTPSLFVVKDKFPNHNFEVSSDSIDFLKNGFIEEVTRRYAITALRDLATVIDENKNVSDLPGMFMEQSRRLAHLMPSTSVGRFSEMPKRIDDYRRRKESGEDTGIRMGIPDFDHLTLGIQQHEYISVVGWQGTGKSTLCQWILFNAYAQGKTPMYISLEMEASALLRKWDTMATHFEYHKLKALELSPEDEEKWEKEAERVSSAPNDIIILDDVRSCTVDRIHSEMVKWEPDLVAIDYISLMDTSRSAGAQMWEKVTYLTQHLKASARNLKIPIIGVAQTNIGSADEGAKLDNIAYSRSIGQDSDLVLGLYCNDEMRTNKQMQVRLLKNRDGMTKSTELLWDMERMLFEPWNEVRHIFNRREEGMPV